MITARFTWDRETFLNGYRAHYREQLSERGHQLLGSLLVALTLVGSFLALTGRGNGMLGAGGAGLIYWYLLRWPFYRWQLTRRFARHVGKDSEIEWEIDEHGFRGGSTGARGEFAWDRVDRVVETDAGFLVSLPPAFYWLPREAFGDQAQAAAFTVLARARVREVVRR